MLTLRMAYKSKHPGGAGVGAFGQVKTMPLRPAPPFFIALSNSPRKILRQTSIKFAMYLRLLSLRLLDKFGTVVYALSQTTHHCCISRKGVSTAMAEVSPNVATQEAIQDEEAEKHRKKSEVEMAQASLETVIFFFQLLMALGLTDGFFIFLSGGSGSYNLRTWSSYSLYEIGVFVVFVTLLIQFMHVDALLLRGTYKDGFIGKKLQPFCDFFLLFIQSGMFYALGHSLTQITSAPWTFFFILNAILIFNIFWGSFIFLFFERKQPEKRAVLFKFSILNLLTIGTSVALYVSAIPMARELLVIALLIRNAVDFYFSHPVMFPGAFDKK